VSLRRILVLLVLVAGLGAYLWLYEVPQARKEAEKEKLLTVDQDAVTGLTLAYPDREIQLAKTDGVWRLTKPVDAPADDMAVKTLLSTLTGAEVQKTLDEVPSDLAPFGLDKPNPTVTVTVKDGAQPPPIAVGKNTTIGAKSYVRKGDEGKVYLTTTSLQFALNKQPKDLREKQLLSFADDDVTRVDIKPATGAPTALVRKDKDAWTVEPGGHPADPTEVRSYLSTLRSTRAVDFPDPADPAKYGLATPRLQVTVATGKDGADTKTIQLGNEMSEGTQKQVYAKRADQPTVYALGSFSFTSLNKGAGQFRDKTIVGFDPGRVGRLSIERNGGGTVTLVRTGDGTWKIDGADDKKPKAESVTRFLDDLRDLRGSDIAAEPPGDLKRFGLQDPDLRIALTDKEGQPIGTILAAKHDGKYYAMRAGAETVFEARDYMYNRLDKQPDDFVEPPGGATSTTLAGDEAAAEEEFGDGHDHAGDELDEE
jgi:hypothetical protein